jgi:hypothetical protein
MDVVWVPLGLGGVEKGAEARSFYLDYAREAFNFM